MRVSRWGWIGNPGKGRQRSKMGLSLTHLGNRKKGKLLFNRGKKRDVTEEERRVRELVGNSPSSVTTGKGAEETDVVNHELRN